MQQRSWRVSRESESSAQSQIFNFAWFVHSRRAHAERTHSIHCIITMQDELNRVRAGFSQFIFYFARKWHSSSFAQVLKVWAERETSILLAAIAGSGWIWEGISLGAGGLGLTLLWKPFDGFISNSLLPSVADYEVLDYYFSFFVFYFFP
jgi:hypothetical protein